MKNVFVMDSAWKELESWDLPEAAYVASLANSNRYTCLNGRARLAISAARGVTGLGSKDHRVARTADRA